MCKKFLGYTWIFLCLFTLASSKIVIRDIVGPSWVKLDSYATDSQDGFTLDCDYVASADETDIVVKWFYNGLEEQIYQWITGVNYPKNPSIVGSRFKNHIDTTYSVLDDGKPSFRALKVTNIDPTLSGNYTCKVSSDISEHVMTKQVVIYSPADPFQIYYIESEKIIICNAVNVAPKPEFDIIVVGANATEIDRPEDFVYTPSEVSEDQVYYNMSITLSYNSSSIPEDSVLFVCRINIPGTNYTEEESVEQVNSDQDLTSSLDNVINELAEGLDDLYSALNATYEDIATLQANSSSHQWSPVLLLMFLVISITCVK